MMKDSDRILDRITASTRVLCGTAIGAEGKREIFKFFKDYIGRA